MTLPLHPTQLRATAALWSLRGALRLLDDRAEEEDRAILAEQAAAADPLRSPTFGRRHALGGHGDPVGDAIDTINAPVRANRWAALQSEVWTQLRDVAEHLPGLDNPLDRIQNTLPHMSERMAEATRVLADRIDGRVRRLLGEPDDRQLIPRVRCPACDAAGLVMRIAAPPAERVVECTTCAAAWPRSEMLAA